MKPTLTQSVLSWLMVIVCCLIFFPLIALTIAANHVLDLIRRPSAIVYWLLAIPISLFLLSAFCFQ